MIDNNTSPSNGGSGNKEMKVERVSDKDLYSQYPVSYKVFGMEVRPSLEPVKDSIGTADSSGSDSTSTDSAGGVKPGDHIITGAAGEQTLNNLSTGYIEIVQRRELGTKGPKKDSSSGKEANEEKSE